MVPLRQAGCSMLDAGYSMLALSLVLSRACPERRRRDEGLSKGSMLDEDESPGGCRGFSFVARPRP